MEKEIASLANSLDTGVKDLNSKRQENARLGSEVAKQEKELRFQVSMKTREVTAERTKTNINWENFKAKKGEQYSIWLESQLEELQATYQQQQEDVRATMEDMYKEKVGLMIRLSTLSCVQKEKLRVELDKARANVDKPDGEASKLKIDLERMRMQLTELEANQQHLKIKKVEITAEQKMKETLFTEQVVDSIFYPSCLAFG